MIRNLSRVPIFGWVHRALGMEIDSSKRHSINNPIAMNNPLTTSYPLKSRDPVFGDNYPVTSDYQASRNIHSATTASGRYPVSRHSRLPTGRLQHKIRSLKRTITRRPIHLPWNRPASGNFRLLPCKNKPVTTVNPISSTRFPRSNQTSRKTVPWLVGNASVTSVTKSSPPPVRPSPPSGTRC